MLSHEAQVLKQGLTVLSDVLNNLEPLFSRSASSPISLLLHEVASSSRPQQAMASVQQTPLLHGVVAAHAYVGMFLHVCKVGQVIIVSQPVAHVKDCFFLFLFLACPFCVMGASSPCVVAYVCLLTIVEVVVGLEAGSVQELMLLALMLLLE